MQLLPDALILVSPRLVPHAVALYDLAGGFPTAFGREGGGPGEFRRIRAVAFDSMQQVHVFADGRETLLSREGELITTRPNLINPIDILFFPDGSYAVSGDVPRRDHAGYPLHVLGPDGQVKRSFGPEGRGFEFDGESFSRSLAHASRPHTFWAARTNRYSAVQYDTAGNVLTAVERRVPWFPAWEWRTTPWEGVPEPLLVDIRHDREGRLWTMVWIADEDFRRISPDDVDIRSPRGATSPLFDTIIEVLDIESGELVLNQRFDRMFSGFHPGGVVGGWDATPEGYQLFEFYRIGIEGLPDS